MTILITGGTGLIGTRLRQMLAGKGYSVIILTRRKDNPAVTGHVSYAYWNVADGVIDKAAIASADHIVHLAGENVAARRWTRSYRRAIASSRQEGGLFLCKALSETPNRVRSVISASAIGWYGEDTESSRRTGFEESAKADTAYLGETCKGWEAGIQGVLALDKRLVILRIGIVLSREGGAFVEFKKLADRKPAGILGSGEQVISWIHIDDLCRLMLFCVENDGVSGVFNAVAPGPVTHEALIVRMAMARGGKIKKMHIPAAMIRILLGGMSVEVLKSTTVSAKKILSRQFCFLYNTIEQALDNL